MSEVAVAPTLAAHVDADGFVWRYGVRDKKPAPTGRRADEFADLLPPGTAVRVLDDPANRELLRRLGARALGPDPIGVRLGRPGLVAWRDACAAGPADVLRELATWPASCLNRDGAPSTGGWRRYAESDARQSDLELAVEGGDDAVIARAVRRHPAYPSLSFLRPLDPVAVGRLMAEVHDPRYFVDPDRPDRQSAFQCFLGLAAPALPRHGDRGRRASLAKAAWWAEGPDGKLPGPGDFVRRYWRANGGPSPAADLKATRLFASFLRLTWLDAVDSKRALIPGQSHGPFVPSYFFAHEPETAGAFVVHRHCRRQDGP